MEESTVYVGPCMHICTYVRKYIILFTQVFVAVHNLSMHLHTYIYICTLCVCMYIVACIDYSDEITTCI